MKRPQVWIAIFAAWNALILFAAATPAWRDTLWGANAWTFLTPARVAVVAIAAAAGALVVFTAPPFPTKAASLAAWAVAGGGLFQLLHDRAHLLGDGRLWIAVLREHPGWHPHEPLAFAGARLAALTAFGDTRLIPGRVETWNVLLGCAALALMIRLAHAIGRERPGQWIALGLFASLGVLQFAFGYVEAYGALSVAVLLFLVSGIDAIERRRHIAWPALAFGLAAGVHGSAFLLFPSLLVVAVAAPGSARSRGAALLAALVPLAFAYALIPLLMPAASRTGGGLEFGLRGWAELLGGATFDHRNLAARLLEQTNRLTLMGGAAMALIGAAAVVRLLADGPHADPQREARDAELAAHEGRRAAADVEREAREGRRAAPHAARRMSRFVPLFLLAAAVGLYAPALLLDMEASRGSAADWDAFAAAALPIAALAAWIWAPRSRRPAIRAAVAACIGVAFFGTFSFVAVNATPAAAVARFESLATSSFRTARSRSWAYETLALYRRENGDMNGAADAYAHALRSQPENPRLIRNAAGALSRAGRAREAAAALSALTRLEPDDFNAWLHLGMEWEEAGVADSALVALRQAVRLRPESLDASNELARLLLGTPDGKREAYGLLRRSLDAEPRQQHAAEMREALVRLEAEGFGAKP